MHVVMNNLALVGAGTLCGLTVILAGVWWVGFLRTLVPFPKGQEGISLVTFLVTYFAIQVGSVLFVWRLVVRAAGMQPPGRAWLALVSACALLLANTISWIFTPAVGGPATLLVLLVAMATALGYEHRIGRRS
jgi:hypothetical protein